MGKISFIRAYLFVPSLSDHQFFERWELKTLSFKLDHLVPKKSL